jgi:hypothetical protein
MNRTRLSGEKDIEILEIARTLADIFQIIVSRVVRVQVEVLSIRFFT